jgi:hypothetical protein
MVLKHLNMQFAPILEKLIILLALRCSVDATAAAANALGLSGKSNLVCEWKQAD